MFKKLLLIWGQQFLEPPRAAEPLATPLDKPGQFMFETIKSTEQTVGYVFTACFISGTTNRQKVF